MTIITRAQAEEALDHMDDFARMTIGVDAFGPRETLQAYIEQQGLILSDLVKALLDMRAGWRYIRSAHGDLYGVGWDRCEESSTLALAAATGELS